jgi:hypothetical protein
VIGSVHHVVWALLTWRGGPSPQVPVDRLHSEGVRAYRGRPRHIWRRRHVRGQQVAGEEAQDGGAIVADGPSSSVITGTVIPATLDRAEGTYA